MTMTDEPDDTVVGERLTDKTDRQVLEEIQQGLDKHFERIEPLLKMAETWTKAKASFGKWGKK
jgi:hypothetical protein